MTRQALALAGILMAAMGLAYDQAVIIWVATALLTASVALRVVSSRRRPGPPADGGNGGN